MIATRRFPEWFIEKKRWCAPCESHRSAYVKRARALSRDPAGVLQGSESGNLAEVALAPT